ncbi:unnamed protein product [Peniophora sp. CBMAI 1063]|nr:unnamed protein product [Peniophora sp. CBMAI 1063]
MLFAWLLAQLPLQVALPITLGFEASLRLLAPTPEPDLRALAAAAFEDYLRTLPWTETAVIYDGFDYGYLPAPILPGLLVASPAAPVHWTTTAVVFDEYVYSTSPVPIIPGLLVASSSAPVHRSASALISDGPVYGSTQVPLIPGIVASPATSTPGPAVVPTPIISTAVTYSTLIARYTIAFTSVKNITLLWLSVAILGALCTITYGLRRHASQLMSKALDFGRTLSISSLLIASGSVVGVALSVYYTASIWLPCIITSALAAVYVVAGNTFTSATAASAGVQLALKRQLSSTIQAKVHQSKLAQSSDRRYRWERRAHTITKNNLDSSRKRSALTTRSLASMTQSFRASSAQCQHLEEKVAFLRGHVNEIKEERNNLAQAQDASAKEQEQRDAQHAQEIQSYKILVATLTTSNAALTTSNATLTSSNATLATTNASLEKQFATLSQSQDTLLSSHVAVDASVRKLTAATKSTASRTAKNAELLKVVGNTYNHALAVKPSVIIMLFAWLLAQLPLQVALPITFGFEASLRLLAPTPEPDLRALVAAAFEDYLRTLPWTETAVIYDSFDYGYLPVPILPGLLVASPTAFVHWTTTAVIFDEYVYGTSPVPIIPGLLVASPSAPVHRSASSLISDGSVYGFTQLPLIPGIVASPTTSTPGPAIVPTPIISTVVTYSTLIARYAVETISAGTNVKNIILLCLSVAILGALCTITYGSRRHASQLISKALDFGRTLSISSHLIASGSVVGVALSVYYTASTWLPCIITSALAAVYVVAENTFTAATAASAAVQLDLERQLSFTIQAKMHQSKLAQSSGRRYRRERRAHTVTKNKLSSSRKGSALTRRSLASVTQSFRASSAQCQDLKEQVAFLRGHVNEIKEERNNLVQAQDASAKEQEQRDAQHAQEIQSYKILVATLTTSNAALTSSNATLATANATLATTNASLEKHADYNAAAAAVEVTHTAEVNTLKTECDALKTECAALKKDAVVLKRNDMEAWAAIAGMRVDMGVLEGTVEARDAEIQRLVQAAQPHIEIPAIFPESASTASLFMASPAPSSDNLLGVQLPADVSSTSIDGFEPLFTPLQEWDTFLDDTFGSGTMIDIPKKIRLVT